MGNLFSIFDPRVLWLGLRLNWFSALISLLLLPRVYWAAKPRIPLIWGQLLTRLAREFKINFNPLPSPGHTHWALALFVFILVNNLGGLRPYTFTASSHLSFSVSLALVRWLRYFLCNMVLNSGEFLAHLVPLGTPYALMPVIVLIELVRNLIRPLTLSVRLAANLVAGHLLMTLIRSPLTRVSNIGGIFLIRGLVILLVLERAVAFIQAYVFRMLRTLYLSETNALKFNYLCNYILYNENSN
jgi:F-type H+-transporting ATPase subunit a